MVGSHPAHERPDEGRCKARVGHRGVRKGRADLRVDIRHPVLSGNLRQIGRPLDAAGLLELGQGCVRRLQEWPERRMIDDEVDPGPVTGRLGHVAADYEKSWPGVWEYATVRQALVDTDRARPRLEDLLVEAIDELLVVEPPVGADLGRGARTTHRVPLPAVRLQHVDRVIDL